MRIPPIPAKRSMNLNLPATDFEAYGVFDANESRALERLYLKNGTLESPITQEVCYCIDSNYWKGSTLENFLTKHRRQLVTDGSRAGTARFGFADLRQKRRGGLWGAPIPISKRPPPS